MGYPPPNEEERLALDVGKVGMHPSGRQTRAPPDPG